MGRAIGGDALPVRGIGFRDRRESVPGDSSANILFAIVPETNPPDRKRVCNLV